MTVQINATITVEKFDFAPNNQSSNHILEISGRSSGILGRILTLIGVGTKSSVIVSRRDVRFTFRGLSGVTHIVCPFHSIRCVEAGVAKPLWQLYLGGALALFGLRGVWLYLTSEFYRQYLQYFGQEALMILAALGIGGVLLFFYVTTKNLALTFSTGSMGDMVGLGFSASKVNGIALETPQILEVIAYINRLMVEVRSGDAAFSGETYIPMDVSSLMADEIESQQKSVEMREKLKQGVVTGARRAASMARSAATEAEKRLNEAQQRRADTTIVNQQVVDPDDTQNLTSSNGWLVDDVKPNPEAARAAFQRANQHGREGKTTGDRREFEKARVAFEEAIRYDPEYTEAYRYLAMTCKMLDDVDAYEDYMGEYERRKAKVIQ